MVSKTISWVSDIGEPTDRGVRYINVAFTDKDTAFIGKKDIDAALEMKGLLEEARDKTLDFTLEDTGKKNKNNGTKWKIRAFGSYQPTPYVQGPTSDGAFTKGRPRSPEHDHYIQERMDRRTALMQAVVTYPNSPGSAVVLADEFYAWLRKTSEPTPSGTPQGDGLQEPTREVGSETTSPVADTSVVGGAVATTGDSNVGGGDFGEGSLPSHEHDWQQHPNMRNFLICSCRATRKKEK